MLSIQKIKTIYLKELKETLRDRRTVFAAIVLPLLLYPLLMLVVTQAATILRQKIQEKQVVAAITGQADAQRLAELLSTEERINLVSSPDPVAALAKGEIQAAINIPPRFQPLISEGSRAEIEVLFNSANELSRETKERIDRALRKYTDEIVKSRLSAHSLDPNLLEPVKMQSVDKASAQQRGGFFLGPIVAILLIVMALLGAFYPAVDLAAGEKERGTIETLLIAPVSRTEIVAGKYLAIITISIITALINLGSLALTFSRLAASLNRGDGAERIAFSVTLSQLLIIFAVLIPFAAMFSALAFAVSSLARSFKEAQNYMTPLMLVNLLPAQAAMLPGINLTLLTALIPGLNVALLTRQALQGSVAPHLVAVTFLATAALAVLALKFARGLFEREEILLRDSGEIDWMFWRSPKTGLRAELQPWHGLLTFAVVLVLLYYVGSYVQEQNLRRGLVITEIALIFAPVWLLIRINRWSPKDVLRFYTPHPLSLIASLLSAAGGLLVVLQISLLANRIIQPPPEFSRAMEKLGKAFQWQNPREAILALIIIAVLPAICEEALNRGLILNSLLKRYSALWSVIVTGLLFGAFHLSPYRFISTALLGILLSWIAYRSGSIYNSILSHAVNNASAVAIGNIAFLRDYLGPAITADGGTGYLPIPAIVVGITLLALGLILLQISPRAVGAQHR